VLWNDSDYDGDTLRVVRGTDGTRDAVTVIEHGAVLEYRAHERFRDVDTLKYTVRTVSTRGRPGWWWR
jgi:hypothetical protein